MNVQKVDVSMVAIVVFAIVLVFLLLVLLSIFLAFFRPWLQAFVSGCPVSVFQLIGMRLRKVDPNKIVSVGIAATQGGHPVGWAELERAYLQGVDLRKCQWLT